MSSVRVVPIGNCVLPDDLVAPLRCCGEDWFAEIKQVVDAAAQVSPLVSPCCGLRFGVRELGAVAFFSRRAWEEAPDDSPPEPFYIGHAFTLPEGIA